MDRTGAAGKETLKIGACSGCRAYSATDRYRVTVKSIMSGALPYLNLTGTYGVWLALGSP
jgi:hypothetical protein